MTGTLARVGPDCTLFHTQITRSLRFGANKALLAGFDARIDVGSIPITRSISLPHFAGRCLSHSPKPLIAWDVPGA